MQKLKKISFSKIMVYLLMSLVCAFMALPLVYVVCSAFKPLDELYIFPPQFFVRIRQVRILSHYFQPSAVRRYLLSVIYSTVLP